MADTNASPFNKVQPDGGNGFVAGFVMGAVLGGIAGYIFASPDGKRKFKDAVEHGEELIESLEEKISDISQADDKGKNTSSEEENNHSIVSNIKRRFFKKGGKRITLKK